VSNITVEIPSVGSDQELPITIAAKPISTRDRNIALVAIVVLAILDAIVIPFAGVQLPRVEAFHSSSSNSDVCRRPFDGCYSVCSLFDTAFACHHPHREWIWPVGEYAPRKGQRLDKTEKPAEYIARLGFLFSGTRHFR
jgi:hypothetical protein